MKNERALPYFDEGRSIQDACGEQNEEILRIIAARYMGENPPLPIRFRGYFSNGVKGRKDGRFDINLNVLLNGSRQGQIAWVKTKFYKETGGNHAFFMKCYGPASIWLNEEEVFRSGVRDENNRESPHCLEFTCKKGWNEMAIRLKKTAGGFGCIFGVQDPGWAWITFLNPLKEQEGKLGFAYTEPMEEQKDRKEIFGEEKNLCWFPVSDWGKAEPERTAAERIYGQQAQNLYVYGWSMLRAWESAEVELLLKSYGESAVFVDGTEVFLKRMGDRFRAVLQLKAGKHFVVVRSKGMQRYGWELAAVRKDVRENPSKEEALPFELPAHVSGIRGEWLYLGPFKTVQTTVEKEPGLYGLFGEENRYWCADEPDVVVRPVLENPAFGKWNYPLGVTLYGLMRLAGILKDESILDYVKAHMRECIRLYDYSLWDAQNYGFPEMNNQLARISTLDDCGSFGSAMLELKDEEVEKEARKIADKIADHMRKVQSRRPDGAFYRIGPAGFPDATMWADDLYMSVPFLCRYYQLTGDRTYLDDAANQFKQFKKYLYLPEQRVLSHVYDFMFDTPTMLPWGRGNGWCFFSLTELLVIMPKEHPDYKFLLDFYRTLAYDYMRLQGESGMWHQLLTHSDSYEETSCTAMFVYGLCRGLRFGWLLEEQRRMAFEAVRKGWHGIISRAVDRQGNVHGICRGSYYSFTPEYYKEELLWSVNDPHGIGIVLLAGIEISLLENM